MDIKPYKIPLGSHLRPTLHASSALNFMHTQNRIARFGDIEDFILRPQPGVAVAFSEGAS
ncbi:hypothetical protein [Noviherbaspirillum sedimenti]|uniref:hypothetical protein n=1 Tax=Noviherbaspirillum sedimenti TaxID=2320865 RepID=UPI0011C45EBA|nr:hypothetical protein [Noviherbaspirillum sedimenti]